MVESDQPKKPIPPGLKPIQKGERRGGRAPGVPNKMTTTLKDAILKAAELVGADGKGKDGLVGYLKDLAGNRKELFVPLLARVLPLQINAKSEEKPVVVYRSLEELRGTARTPRQRSHARTSYQKPDGTQGAGRYTDDWQLRDGHWQCVSAHVTRL